MTISAGLLMYRRHDKNLQVFLGHPGGPFYKTNNHVWGIFKGLCEKDEELFTCAKREFTEETGIKIQVNISFISLGHIQQSSNKIVHAWAFEWTGPDIIDITSNLTPFGWPEIDKAKFFPLDQAKKIILPAQKIFLDRLTSLV